jgi:hypothetical protein
VDWFHYAYAGPVLPLFASSPVPASGSVNVSTAPNLNWQAGNGATAHQVYFGTNPILSGPNYQGQQTSTNFTLPALAPNTTYYWRVDEVNSNGVQAGNVWSFTTWWTPPQSISITNHSFESQIVSSGSFLPGDPTSWHSSLLAGTVDAVVNPGPLGSGEPWPADPPSGLDATNVCQIYAISAGGGGLVYQDTGVKYQPGTVYQLTAVAGLQINQTFNAGSLIGFYNSSLTCIASNVINSATLFYGTFTGQSVSYTTTGAEGGNGDIIVGFYAPPAAAAGSYFDFDNVQLTQYNQGPLLNSPPGSQTTSIGGTATFSVGATGTAPLSYQWQANGGTGFTNLINGGQVSGATSNILGIASVTTNWALAYQVIVTNGYGTVTSSPAVTLTVATVSQTTNLLIDVNFVTSGAPGQTGAAVLGSSNDVWNALSASTSIITNNFGGLLSGVGLTLSCQGVFIDAGGSVMDAATTPLMQDYAYGTTAPAAITVSLTGLTKYTNSSFTLVIFGAGDGVSQGVALRLTAGATDGNTASNLTTSAASRQISAGIGIAYQTFTGTLTNGTLTFVATNNGSIYTIVNGFQLQLVPPTTVSRNAWLTSLALSPAGNLHPTFAPNVLTYAATEVYGSRPTVTVTNADLTAVNQLIYNGATNLLASGAASIPMNLTLGMTNVMQVQVTAQDGVTLQTYTMNVTELPNQATPPMLTNSVSNGTLNLNWGLDRLGYRLLIQTNNLNSGLSTDLHDWATVTGSMMTNLMIIPIGTTNLNEYYRLVYP